MGAGASAASAASIKAASADELQEAAAALSDEDRKRILTLLDASSSAVDEKAPAEVSSGGPPSAAQVRLWTSSWKGDTDGVKAAMEEGADLNAPRYGQNANGLVGGGATAAMQAARGGMHECLKALKELGANLEAKDDDGWTIVHFAARNGRIKCLEMLVELGVDFGAQTKWKKNALDLVEEAVLDTEGEDATAASVATFLKEKGLKLSPQGTLFTCSKTGDDDGVRAAVKDGADINLGNVNAFTAAMCAARAGQAKTLKVLKELGADLAATDRDEWTVVHFAAFSGQLECLKVLAELEVDMTTVTKFKRNAVDLLEEKIMDSDGDEGGRMKEAVKFLRAQSMRSTPQWELFKAARLGDPVAVEMAVKKGADVNLKSVSGCSAFMTAADFGQDACLQKLKDLGADLEASDRDGWTALHFAACSLRPKTLKTLLSMGSSLSAETKFRRNALDLAEDQEMDDFATDEKKAAKKEVISCLKLKKLKPSAQGMLWKKSKTGDVSGVLKALERGADINLRDLEGNTAAMYAAQHEDKECLNALKEAGAVYEG